MAKLSGVTTVSKVNGEIKKVAFEGAVYALVPSSERGEAVIGDLVLITDNSWCDAQKDAFYMTVGLSDENPRIVDDVNVYDSNFYDGSYELYRKVEADKTPEPATTKRKAAVGERILITNANLSSGQYANGDILTVRYANSSGVKVNEHDGGLWHGEYEVIDEGKSLRKADKPALKVGDYAVILRGAMFVSTGDVVEIRGKGGIYDFTTLRVGDGKEEPMDARNMRKATDEEVDHAKKDAPFTKIGRNPGEFKKGDIVRGYSALEDHVLYGVITDLPAGTYTGVSIGAKYRALMEIELIAPVESRVDDVA